MKKGFTLIEVLVVISIIATLSSIVLSATNNARSKGREGQRISQIHQVKQALSLYYSKNGVYPYSMDMSWATVLDQDVAYNWQQMMMELNSDGDMSATFWTISQNNTESNKFTFVKKAFAALAPAYFGSSVQDPLYREMGDYMYSYGYQASADQKSYILRVYIEDLSSPLFSNTISGPFWNPALPTGDTACDKTLHYYCVGSIL